MELDYDLKAIQEMVNNHIGLMTIDAKGLVEARDRASKFLVVSAILISALKDLEETMAKTQTIVNATYAQAAQSSTGKNVTEKKLEAESSPHYAQARETHEQMEAKRSYLKNFIKIFENAHLMYRQYAKES